MKYAAIVFLGLVFIALEVLLGNLGIALPLTGFWIFYLALLFPWYYPFWAALIAGAILDFLYLRNGMISVFLLMIYAGAGLVCRKNYAGSFFAAAAGIFIAGGIWGTVQIVYGYFIIPDFEAGLWAARMFFAMAAGAGLSFLMLRLSDRFLGALPGYPVYFLTEKRGGIGSGRRKWNKQKNTQK